MTLNTLIKPGKRLKLSKHDPGSTFGVKKAAAQGLLLKLSNELGELQELLAAARQHALLVVLQGIDTSGKDGTIRNVMSQVNPQGCRVESFKVPSAEELSHDFLWRVHDVVPPRGMMTIFNRSHYEDVLVVRVHELVPKPVWKARYDHINAFEQLLADSGTIVLKFFLHISRDEQRARLESREEDAGKAWKLSVGDWTEREHWEDYEDAYEDAISRCSTDIAPWHVIPANKKWFRNLAVADAIVRALRPYRRQWEDRLSALSRTRLAELAAMRAAKKRDSS